MLTVNVQMRVWRYAKESTRIHYVIERADGSARHLYVDQGDALYDVLAEHLADTGRGASTVESAS